MSNQTRTYKTKVPKWNKETLQSLLAKQKARKDFALSTLLHHKLAKKD